MITESKVYQGNCEEILKNLPEKSIDCCVTSPPYYGLRDYGMKDQIGLEDTPEEYIERLVRVFREVRRVLKDDGTLWVNIGDTYNSSPAGSVKSSFQGTNNKGSIAQTYTKHLVNNCKPKDLIGIPWLLAFALRSDGWYLRQDIIWHKPNPMPESVTDRCTKSHEYIFLLSKKQRYYFDYKSIQEPMQTSSIVRLSQNIESQTGSYTPSKGNGKMKAVGGKMSKYRDEDQESSVRQGMNKNRGNKTIQVRRPLPNQSEFVSFLRERTDVDMICNNTDLTRTKVEHWFRTDKNGFSYPSVDDWKKARDFIDDWGEEFRQIDYALTDVIYESDEIGKNNNWKRNKRDVWSITTKPLKESHFATFPEDLIKPCILAGSQVGGVVLDPFFGSGTTGRVAMELNRMYIGIELNPDYIEISKKRTNNVQMSFIGMI